jgi:ceramide glucosyltransferase
MIAAALVAGYLVLLLAKTWLAVRAARRAPRAAGADADLSRVVVAQPILSGDPGLSDVLEDNLRSLPSAHFAWLVDADDQTAQVTCLRLQERYGRTRIDILTVAPPPASINPKLFKLERTRSLLGDRVLLVLDDDTRMPAASLAAIVEGLERSELATGLPAYLDDGRWRSRLLAQFVNNNAALTYLPLLNLRPPVTINGMAYVMRAVTLERLGGFGPVMASITDDLAVAQHVLAAGGRICQTAAPVWVQTTIRDGRHYLRQMHRWFLFAWLLVRLQPAGLQALIALLQGLPPLLFWGVAAAVALRPSPAAFVALGVLLAVRATLLVALQRHIYGRPLHQPVTSVISELLQPLHFCHALLQPTIVWRTRRFRVRDDRTFQARP